MKLKFTSLIILTLLITNTSWAIEPKALILIEYQNEWISKEGKLRKILIKDEKSMKQSIENSKKALNHARKNNFNIIHVTMNPGGDYRIFGSGKYGLRAAIPKAETWQGGMEDIHPDFTPEKNEYLIKERTGASAFAGSSLDSYLRNNDIKDIYLMGYALNVCVESTLRQGHDLGYNVHILLDCTSSFTGDEKEFFEKHIIHHFGYGLKLREFMNQ